MPGIGFDKADPIGNTERQINTLCIGFKLILRIVRNQNRQSAARIEIFCLFANQDCFCQGLPRFCGFIYIKV